MSRTIIMLFTLISASLALALPNPVVNYEEKVLSRLLSSSVSKSEKISMIQRNKDLMEERLKDLIVQKSKSTDLAKTYEVIDQLTILSQVKLLEKKGCVDARAMMSLSLMNPTDQSSREMTELEAKTLQVLQSLCR